MKKYCIGVDIGGTTVKHGLFDIDGNILDKWQIPTRTENNGAAILPDIALSIKEKLQERGITTQDVAGVGVGIPGPVDRDGAVSCAVNLHWGYVDVSKEMKKLVGLPVKAGNDANVAALGEMWKGGGEGNKNVIFVTLGTGVGGGIIVDGKMIAGANGAGGEIGHAHVNDEETVPCNCGNAGCLEQVASATGIANLARKYLETQEEDSVLRKSSISAKSVFDAVKEGDAVAIKIAEQFGSYLGKALAVFATVTDPEIFVIGGGVSKAGVILLDYIQKYYQKYAFIGSKETPFSLAKLGNDAGIYGAAKLVLD